MQARACGVGPSSRLWHAGRRGRPHGVDNAVVAAELADDAPRADVPEEDLAVPAAGGKPALRTLYCPFLSWIYILQLKGSQALTCCCPLTPPHP